MDLKDYYLRLEGEAGATGEHLSIEVLRKKHGSWLEGASREARAYAMVNHRVTLATFTFTKVGLPFLFNKNLFLDFTTSPYYRAQTPQVFPHFHRSPWPTKSRRTQTATRQQRRLQSPAMFRSKCLGEAEAFVTLDH
jgi:hypothetical protein